MKPYSLRSFVPSFEWNELGFIIQKSYMIFVIEPAHLCRHGCQAMPIVACLSAITIAPGQ